MQAILDHERVAARVTVLDSVVDGETGILVEPGDPADLARGILRLLADREEGKRLGAAGRERMLGRFTLAHTARGLATLYRDQRQSAPGGWRLHRSFARLFIAAALYAPVLGRSIVYDLFCRNILPHIYHSLIGRLWHHGSKLLGRPSMDRQRA